MNLCPSASRACGVACRVKARTKLRSVCVAVSFGAVPNERELDVDGHVCSSPWRPPTAHRRLWCTSGKIYSVITSSLHQSNLQSDLTLKLRQESAFGILPTSLVPVHCSQLYMSSTKVPYFVLRQDDGKARAVFTVPNAVVSSVTSHPVLCRGSAFQLQLDDTNPSLNDTVFVMTEYESPHPEDTALEIAKRLTVRVQDGTVVAASMVPGNE